MKVLGALLGIALLVAWNTSAEARGGGHYYGGGIHTSSHGGSYSGQRVIP
jgi:hypothetical protein